MDKLTKKQENVICELLHYARSEEITQFILNRIGKENWSRDILSDAMKLTNEQEDFQASVGCGYTSEEIDEHFYIDDVNYIISELLKSQGVTPYLYENEEYVDAIRRGEIVYDGIDVNAIKKSVSEEGRESDVLMDLHQRYDMVVDDWGVYSVLKGGKWGFADLNGIELVPPKYDLNIHSWEDEDAVVVGYRDGIDFRMGMVSKQGVEWVEPKYETLYYRTEDGLAFVKLDGKWGLIDRFDNIIIPCVYETINWENGKVAATLNGEKLYFDCKGNRIKA